MQHYNRLKAAINGEQSEVRFDSVDREKARTQFLIVLTEKERADMWLSEQIDYNFFYMHTYEIVRHIDVDVKELFLSSK